MDIYTKVFLVNFISFLFTSFVDKEFLEGALIENIVTSLIFKWWAVFTLVSIPSLGIYLILGA